MDEGGNPTYLVPILIGVIVLLAILLIGMIIVYCRQYKKGRADPQSNLPDPWAF